MMSSNGNIFRVTGLCAGNSPVICEFPAQRPGTRTCDVFFDLRLNERLSKQWWGWWFETLSCPLWRHRNDHLFPLISVRFKTLKRRHISSVMASHISRLFNNLFMLASKKASKLCIYGPLWEESIGDRHRWPVDSPHKGPVMRKAFPCYEVIMKIDHLFQ